MNANRWFVGALTVVLLLGVGLRLWQYGARESFWKDETGLARNFYTHTLATITEPLQDNQAAPPGFLQISKLAEMAWGHEEKVFWLLPLLEGIAMLFAAAIFWRRELPGGAWLLAVGALAFNTTLINHVTQFKPYLTDAFAALLVCGAFFYQRRSSRMLPYVAAGVFALWMSYTAVFVIAGLGLWQLGEAFAGRKKLWKPLTANSLLGLVFVFLYVVYFSHVDDAGGFRRFWANNFVPFSPAIAGWLSSDFGSVVGYLFGHAQWLWLLFFIALGVVRAWGVNRALLALLLPVAMTFGASFLRLYPVYDRLEVFWVPLLTPLLALGVAWVWETLCEQSWGVGAVFLLFVAVPFLHPLRGVGGPDPQQLKQATLALAAKAKAGDVIYLHPRCTELYRYYFRRYPPVKGVVVDFGQPADLENLHATLAKHYAGRHVFMAFTEPMYVIDEIRLLVEAANKRHELISVAELNLAGALELRMAGKP